MSSSTKRHRIFRDERYLTPGFTPDRVVGRDDLIEQLETAMQPVAHRRNPEHVLLYGPAGSGKTTVANHILAELEATSRVTTACINCWQYNTRPALLAELLIQLGYPAPRKGKPVDELLGKLHEWLPKHHGVVVSLDEGDQLRHLTEILYDLHHASMEAATALGLLLVSHRPAIARRLDARSESRLNLQPIYVPPYDADELYEILTDRADAAFHSDVVQDDLLHRIAETIASTSGDCRRALALLLLAGRRAAQEEAREVSLEHLPQLRD